MDPAWQAVMPWIVVLSFAGLSMVLLAVASFRQNSFLKWGRGSDKAGVGYKILGWMFVFIALACFSCIGVLVYIVETLTLDLGPMF